MLFILCCWIIITLITYSSGDFLLRVSSGFFKSEHVSSFSLTCLTGFAFLSLVCSWISLFAPIDLIIFTIVFGVSITWLLGNAKRVKKTFASYINEARSNPLCILLLFTGGFITALIYCALPTKCFDEGFYYLQTIRWNSAYPVVHGLGNFECRLAFNSSWHLLAALFNFSFVKSFQFDDINGLLFLFAYIYGLGGLKKLINRGFSLSALMQTGILFCGFLFYFSIMAPAPDLAVTYFIWIVFVLFAQKAEKGNISEVDGLLILIWIFSLFLVTVKLSAVIILIIPIYFGIVILRSKQWKVSGVMILTGIMVLTPWLIRNVVLSGYLFYPIAVFNIFPYDWKMPLPELHHLNCAIEAWAKISARECESVNAMHFSQWVPIWFSAKRPYDKIILIMALLSLIGLIMHFLKNTKKQTKAKQPYYILFFTILAALAIWFFKAPDPRFGYVFLVNIILVATGGLFRNFFSSVKTRFILISAAAGGLIMMNLFLFILEKHQAKFSYIISPAPYPAVHLSYFVADGQKIFVPSDFLCWDAPLPCNQKEHGQVFHFRGKDAKDGFTGKQAQ